MSGAKTPTDEMYGQISYLFDRFNNSFFEGKLPFPLITLQRKKQTAGYFHIGRFVSQNSTADELALNPEYFGMGDQETYQTICHEMCHIWQAYYGKPSRAGYHNKEWADKMISIGLMPTSTGKAGGKITGQRMGDIMVEDGPFHQELQNMEAEGAVIRWRDRYQRRGSETLVAVTDEFEGSRHESQGDTTEHERDEAVSVPHVGSNALQGESEAGTYSRPDKEVTTLGGVEYQSLDMPVKKTKAKYFCRDCGFNLWGKPNLNIICGECRNPFLKA